MTTQRHYKNTTVSLCREPILVSCVRKDLTFTHNAFTLFLQAAVRLLGLQTEKDRDAWDTRVSNDSAFFMVSSVGGSSEPPMVSIRFLQPDAVWPPVCKRMVRLNASHRDTTMTDHSLPDSIDSTDALHERLYQIEAISTLITIAVANASMERYAQSIAWAAEVIGNLAHQAKELANHQHDMVRGGRT